MSPYSEHAQYLTLNQYEHLIVHVGLYLSGKSQNVSNQTKPNQTYQRNQTKPNKKVIPPPPPP